MREDKAQERAFKEAKWKCFKKGPIVPNAADRSKNGTIVFCNRFFPLNYIISMNIVIGILVKILIGAGFFVFCYYKQCSNFMAISLSTSYIIFLGYTPTYGIAWSKAFMPLSLLHVVEAAFTHWPIEQQSTHFLDPLCVSRSVMSDSVRPHGL